MKSLSMFLLTAAVLLSAQGAFAQRDAATKARGEYNFHGNSASGSIRNARESSANYLEYARTSEQVNPELATETVDEIGQFITKAQKHMASMRKHAAGDKQTLTALDSIDKNLAQAAKSQAEMRATCHQDKVDGPASLVCCKAIDESLAKAIAEHDKLMKRLSTLTRGKN